jgi:S1-C subfamily serine protease
VIVSVDGRTVNSPDDLGSILDSIRPDTTVPVEIVGPSGDQRTIQVTLAERPLPVNIP